MDAVTLTSLGLKTLQLALQSGLTLYQFVQETRNVNATVRELAIEVKSLGNACRVVHEQLRMLAGEYELSHGNDKQSPVSTSIQKELESCQKTLRTLRGSLVDVRGNATNFAKQGWRQLKLNMKQDEIFAMKSRIQSHTSALQVCLLVMDINVSHLAPKRVGIELKAKLDGLGLEMQRLQGLLRAHCEKVDLMLRSGSAVTLSAASAIGYYFDTASICSTVPEDLDNTHLGGKDGPGHSARSILACAQDTLSRATSLYEESLYEPSISSTALSRKSASSRNRGSTRIGYTAQAQPVELVDVSTPAEGLGFTMPLNLPASLQLGFQKLQEHLHDRPPGGNTPSGSATAKSYEVVAEEHSEIDNEKRGRNGQVTRSTKRQTPLTKKQARQTLREADGSDPAEAHTVPFEELREESSPSRLSYLKHVEGELRDFDTQTLADSTKAILSELLSLGPKPLCNDRVALTGKLGIGKTYIAAAAVQLTIRKGPKLPVFWISASELEDDCQSISDRLGLKRPSDGTTPWDWLCKILRRLSMSIIGPWLVVIDGVSACVRDHEIEKLAKTDIGSVGQVMLTTRMRGHAETFATEGLVFNVSRLDPVYAANMLAQDSGSPVSGTFDAVAFFLNFEPYAIVNVRRFLKETGMEVDAFAAQLGILTDEASWHEQGIATATARLLSGRASPKVTSLERGSDTLSLLPVARCCLHPSWSMVFEALHRQFPAASELLGALSAIGRADLTGDFLLVNDARRAASTTLVSQCLLSRQSDTFHADRMMLLAHRVWLLGRDGLSAAYAEALRMVAHDYPEAPDDPGWNHCRAMEPLAVAVTSATADSWVDKSNTARWSKSMLLHKRSRFFRDSGTNKWEGEELEAAEVKELQIIHGMNDLKKGR